MKHADGLLSRRRGPTQRLRKLGAQDKTEGSIEQVEAREKRVRQAEARDERLGSV